MIAGNPAEDAECLLEVEDLWVSFGKRQDGPPAVRGAGFRVRPGRTLAIVGESGSGKSVTARTVMRLLTEPEVEVSARRMAFRSAGEGWIDLLELPPGDARLRRLHAREMALVFQQSLNCLNPVLTVGWQIAERLMMRAGGARRRVRRLEAERLLEDFGIFPGQRVARLFPHQLSGGMRQRVMLAMALAGRPRLLIADEATTALDATVQLQILNLLQEARVRHDLGLVLITHDLGLVADQADDVVVFHEGAVVEGGTVKAVFSSPRHPYTGHLLATRIPLSGEGREIPSPAGWEGL